MSAAANAAGYLYAHGQLAVSDLNGRVDVPRSPHAAKSQSSRRLEPETVPSQLRTPKVEYRKRRAYALPSAA